MSIRIQVATLAWSDARLPGDSLPSADPPGRGGSRARGPRGWRHAEPSVAPWWSGSRCGPSRVALTLPAPVWHAQGRMTCPLCHARKARRQCPALDRHICAVCCGTKRLVEIACPADCQYLASARAHPPAAVQRRRGRDLRFALPLLRGLSEPAGNLLLAIHAVIAAHRRTAIPPINDADVADAAGSLAATFETAARGIIYDHQPASLPAQRLVVEMKDALREAGRAAGSSPAGFEREAADVLRRVERAAREARHALEPGDSSYLAFVERFLRDVADQAGDPDAREGRAAPAPPSRLVLP
jgi:hypothetical protein